MPQSTEPGRVCRVCGDPIPPNRRSQWCSPRCYEKHRRPGPRPDRNRTRGTSTSLRCERCNQDFEWVSRTREPKYCPSCRVEQARERRREAEELRRLNPPTTICSTDGCDRVAYCKGLCRAHYTESRRHFWKTPPTETVACKRCGQSFDRTIRAGSAQKVYCSDSCHVAAKRDRFTKHTVQLPTPLKATLLRYGVCDVCGAPFVCRQSSPKRYCSTSCAHVAENRRRPYLQVEVQCQQCGVVENRRVKAGHPPTICQECRRRNRKSPESVRQARRRHRARYGKSYRGKARRLGVTYEPVNRLKVYERDGWRCGLCGKKVKRNTKVPDPMAPTLDHIVPMNAVDLGEHTYANTQCAHFECNWRKAAGGSQQLRLVG